MMAEKNDVKPQVTLIVGPEWLTEIKNPTIKVVSNLKDMLECISHSENTNNTFLLVIPSDCLKLIADFNIHELNCINAVHIYYNSINDYNNHTKQYKDISKKFSFHITTDLMEKLLTTLQSKDKLQVKSIDRSKLNSMRPRPLRKTNKKNVVVSSTVSIDTKCRKCSSVFENPFQLNCGHRQCKSCLDKQDGSIIQCIECEEQTPRKELWFDLGFKRQLEGLNKINVDNAQ